jgi:amino acid transporter
MMRTHSSNRSAQYTEGSISLSRAVAMGTGVMIGAGIFALIGQVAEQAREWFPYAFLVAAIITAFSAYSYVKLSNAYPSAGGIATFLEKAYGKGMMSAFGALLMYFSMVINESLVARTFGTYTLQLFDVGKDSWLIPALGVGLLFLVFLINISGNKFIGTFSFITSFIKIGGIALFAISGLWFSGFSFKAASLSSGDTTMTGFIAALALSILSYKGFTTITNSGSEIKDPHRNVGRAIIISISICTVVYALVAFAVASNLSIDEIIAAKNFALAEAARPVFGNVGIWFTVILAIVATASGLLASTFAASRMLAMLTDMKLVPHSHFGMPGDIQKHTLVYTIIIAIFLTVFFDLSRIASLGAIFYIIMDIAVHYGIFRYLRKEIHANSFIVLSAIVFDVIILAGFLYVKASSDVFVLYAAAIGIACLFGAEKIFLKLNRSSDGAKHDNHSE